MSKITIGMVLSQLMADSNLSAIHLADRLDKSRQSVYLDLKRTSMRDEQIAEYAKALGVDVQQIHDRLQGKDEAPGEYLQKYLESLEEKFERLLNQLNKKDEQIHKKDEQIQGLQRTVDVLLGKSDVSEEQACKIIALRTYQNSQIVA